MFELPFLPRFARLDEWFSPFAYEPVRFFSLLRTFQTMDWARHMAEPRAEAAGLVGPSMIPGRGNKSVAVIPVVGTMLKQRSSMGGTSTLDIRQAVRAAANNEQVSGILLAIDSPGGSISGTETLAQDIKAATKRKPVYAQIDDLGASAGYWIASQADSVFASNSSTSVGSIGVILSVADDSGASEKTGIKVKTYTSGPLKGAGHPGVAISDEQDKYFQGLVDGWQTIFSESVKSGRRLSSAQLARVTSGGVFLAREAQQLGLVDGVRPMEQTISELIKAR